MINIATKKDLKYAAAAAREIPASKFVPYTRAIDDYTLATKEGYLLQIIKLQGLPFETADQLDLNHAKNIRANMLKAISNSRFGIYQHVIRRQIKNTNPGFFENTWCQDLEHAYQNRLATKKMFINEHYLTIIRRPATSKVGMISEILKTISGKIDQNVHADLQKEAHQALSEAVSNILSTLSPYTPQLLKLTDTKDGLYSEQLSFLSYLINGEMREIRLPCMSLADYLPSKRISFGKENFEIRGSAPDDIKLGGILSVKEYTNATGPGMLDGLLRLPHEFIITQSFGFVDRQTSLSSINEATRKMIASDAGAHSLIEDMEQAKDELSSGRTSFGEHHLTITALGKTTDELAHALSECHGELVNMGMMAAREDINLEAAFWAQLPGNFSYIARRSLISTHNFASLASLHNFPAGHKDDNHWGAAITQFETTSGTPYWFNFHERDVGNFTLIGPTGTGKTVLLTFLMAQARRISPTCIYFDKDRGAEIFIRAINGTYTVVRAGRPTGLNPLQLPDTPENRSFLKDWLTILIESDGGTPLTPHEHEILNDAITANYETSPKNRRLSHLCELLSGYGGNSEYMLITRMADWHGEGSRAWLFDNEQDTLPLDNPILGFDLTSILDDPLSRTPWLLYIFHRITALLDGRKTIIMLDEGWKMLDDPAFSARIKDWMKTIRKQNGIVGFATQSAKDACGSAIGDAIIEQSPTQIFLPNARAQEKDYCGGFGLSAHELEIIRKLTPQSRCFLIRHGTESIIAKLDLSGMDQFINVLSGRTESIRHMEDLIITHGQAPENWLPHFHEERNAA